MKMKKPKCKRAITKTISVLILGFFFFAQVGYAASLTKSSLRPQSLRISRNVPEVSDTDVASSSILRDFTDKSKRTCHLKLTKDMLEGAKFAFLPGDPARVEKIARSFDKDAKKLMETREFTTWLGYINGVPVVCTSTGIGTPSASMAVEELAMLGVKTFIRVGTTGAIQNDVEVGNVVITDRVIGLDGTSGDYLPDTNLIAADVKVTDALMKAADFLRIVHHKGTTATTST